jgi:hypothetical protein
MYVHIELPKHSYNLELSDIVLTCALADVHSFLTHSIQLLYTYGVHAQKVFPAHWGHSCFLI